MKKACPCGQPQKVLHSGRLRLYPQTRGLPEKKLFRENTLAYFLSILVTKKVF
jgi:hypothetical protein